jgi:dynein heavy chain, axonemal
MIYMEPESLGWKPIFESWKRDLPAHYSSDDKEEIDSLFYWCVDYVCHFIRKNC